jgi:hypothetical protein
VAEEEAATAAIGKRRRSPARLPGGCAATDLRLRSPGKEEEAQVAVRRWEAAASASELGKRGRRRKARQ